MVVPHKLAQSRVHEGALPRVWPVCLLEIWSPWHIQAVKPGLRRKSRLMRYIDRG